MSDPKKPSSPFAALATLRDALPRGPETQSDPASPASEPRGAEPFSGKIVVAKSRKGRGGKTVTAVTGVKGDAAALEVIARELKHALGCGAAVEDGAIVVQGEQGPRIKAWLESRGAKRVVIGS